MDPQKSSTSIRSNRSTTTLGRKTRNRCFIPHLDFEKEIGDLFEKHDLDGVYLCRNQQNGSPLRTGTSTLTQYPSHLYQLNTIYDSQDELVELLMSKTRHIPRVLMQCITALSPHCRYLTKFSILKSRLNGYVLLELKRMLQLSNLTEIVLDGSVLTESSYAVLLEDGSKLRYLSLARCGVSDEECEKIAYKIDCKVSADSNLALLNLSSNQISDAGVKRLALALRTNRSLRYLNLANNRISDDGAMPLLNVFMEFPLTYDDISAKQARYCVYIKEKVGVLNPFYDDINTGLVNDESSRKAEKSKNSRSVGAKKSKKDMKNMTPEPISARDGAKSHGTIRVKFNDPFAPDYLKFKDGVIFCVGNMVLCYLNLSFNNLSYLSVKKLETVMVYQRDIKKPTDFGLMKVVIEGNPLPENCAEYNTLNQLMMGSIFRCYPGNEGRRKNSMQQISPKK